MKLFNVILGIVIGIAVFALLGSNTQDDGRTYFTIKQGSVNEIGSGYGSDGTGTPFNYDGTGFYRFEFPVGAVSNSEYSDDGIWYELGGLGIGDGTLTTVYVDLPVTGDGTSTTPIDIDSSIAGYGLSMTTNIMDVNTGDGIGITDDNVVFVSTEVGTTTWGTAGAEITWTFDTSEGTDPTMTWGDILVTFDIPNVGTTGSLFLEEQADAIADIAGWGQIWVNTATPNELWFTDDAGTDFQLGTAGTVSLDMAYDSGDTIDYSSGNGPIHMNFPDACTIEVLCGRDVSNLYMSNSTTSSAITDIMTLFHYDTDTVLINDILTGPLFIGGYTGHTTPELMWGISPFGTMMLDHGLTVNSGNNANGDIVWKSAAQANAMVGNADGETMTFAVPVHLGDADTEGALAFHDGDGESGTWFCSDATDNFTVDFAGLEDGTAHQMVVVASNAGNAPVLGVENAVVDTDTHEDIYSIGDTTGTTIIAAVTPIICPVGACAAGTANYATVYIDRWTVDFGNTDTVTFTLYVNGVAKDTWTTDAGAAGLSVSNGSIDEAIAQGDYIQIIGEVTNQVVGLDMITAQSYSIRVVN